MSKSLLPRQLDAYIEKTFAAQSPLQQRLRDFTATLPDAQMLSTPDQSVFLSLLVRLTRAKNILEIGTFTGYSAIALASALPDGGHLTCLDINPLTTAIAQKYWTEAGLADRITLRLAPAADTLRELLTTGHAGTFDFAFIDADKTAYDTYYELALQLLAPGSAMLFDNMIRPGVAEGAPVDAAAKAIAALNQKIATDPRVHATLLPVGPGMVLAVRSS